MREGMRLTGYVRSTTDFGLFIGFVHGISAMADRRHLAASFVREPATRFSKGQTVVAEVLKVWLAIWKSPFL